MKQLVLELIPAAGFGCVCVCVCVCACAHCLERKSSITFLTGQNISALPPATMVLPLSALGVLLFSLASSAEIVPQAEFNLQKVSRKSAFVIYEIELPILTDPLFACVL